MRGFGAAQVAQAEGHVGSVACVCVAEAAAFVCVVSCGGVDGLVKARGERRGAGGV